LKKYFYAIKAACSFLFLLLIFGDVPLACAYPVSLTDSKGHEIVITERPSRVISLVPAITEIIFAIGAGQNVHAVTYHSSTYPREANSKKIVGGFFSPSLDAIEQLQPDMIFLSELHNKVMERFSHGKYPLINLETNSISDSYNNIQLLGRIFNKENEAADIVRNMKEQLALIAEKVDKIPPSKRKRVIRLMGRQRVMAPGDDSFQNECIELAGGSPPRWARQGPSCR